MGCFSSSLRTRRPRPRRGPGSSVFISQVVAAESISGGCRPAATCASSRPSGHTGIFCSCPYASSDLAVQGDICSFQIHYTSLFVLESESVFRSRFDLVVRFRPYVSFRRRCLQNLIWRPGVRAGSPGAAHIVCVRRKPRHLCAKEHQGRCTPCSSVLAIDKEGIEGDGRNT
jgi:hypothetical protein